MPRAAAGRRPPRRGARAPRRVEPVRVLAVVPRAAARGVRPRARAVARGSSRVTQPAWPCAPAGLVGTSTDSGRPARAACEPPSPTSCGTRPLPAPRMKRLPQVGRAVAAVADRPALRRPAPSPHHGTITPRGISLAPRSPSPARTRPGPGRVERGQHERGRLVDGAATARPAGVHACPAADSSTVVAPSTIQLTRDLARAARARWARRCNWTFTASRVSLNQPSTMRCRPLGGRPGSSARERPASCHPVACRDRPSASPGRRPARARRSRSAGTISGPIRNVYSSCGEAAGDEVAGDRRATSPAGSPSPRARGSAGRSAS